MLTDLIAPKVSTDPGRLINFFTPEAPQTLVETHKDLFYPRVCGDPLFYFLHTLKFTKTLVLNTSLKKLFILKNTIIYTVLKCQHMTNIKNEQLDKKIAIFYSSKW
jgi:hypothetical protein